MKRILSVLLALCLLAGALPLSASATTIPGTCGPDAHYTVKDGTLTIYGTGATNDYWTKPTLTEWQDPAPYWVYSDLIKRIVIEEGITRIGANSFYAGEYPNLVSVQFPESLEEIGDKAFSRTPLTEIHLPKGIKKVGEYAFEKTNISSIEVTRADYGQGVFRGCEKLKTITYLDEGTGVWYPGFPECNGLTSVTIPGYVKDTEDFTNCENLEAVIMEEGVEAIPQGAFLGCKSLREVRMPVTSLKSIGKHAFYRCSKLKTFVIPRSDPALSNDVFWTMSNLRNVIVPKEIKTIYGNVFSGCDELWNIYEESAEHSFMHIDYAFPYGDRKFAMIMNGDRGARHYSFDIGAFGFQSGLTDREPEGASAPTPTPSPTPSPSPSPAPSSGKCGPNASYAIQGKELVISGSGPIDDFEEWKSPWYNAKGLTSLVIQPGITRIGNYAFSHMSFSEKVSIPGTVTSIGNDAFSYGTHATVVIPSSVTQMGTGVFQHSGVKEVKIYADIATLPGAVFNYCTSLERVWLSGSIDTLSAGSFANTWGLKHIYTYGSWEEIFIHDRADVNAPAYDNKPRGLAQAKKHTLTGTPSDDPALGTATPDPTPTPSPAPGASPSPDPDPENKALIYYEANGGTGYMAPQAVEPGQRFPLLECGFTPPQGKEFDGWLSRAGLRWDPGETPTAPFSAGGTLTFTAQWKDKTSPSLGGFTDVHEGDYYASAVAWALEKGVTSGAAKDRFGVGSPCKREQIATFLWRANGSPAATQTANFDDMTNNAVFNKAISWAVEEGITSGTGNNKFGVGATCTRVQAVTFLWIAAGRPTPQKQAAFSDMTNNAVFNNAISWAVEKGVTGGTGNNKFSPNKPCTREQIVTFLYQAYK